MALTYLDAIAAYKSAAQSPGAGMGPREGASGSDFADLLKVAAGNAVSSLGSAEQAVAAAIDGKADLSQVVTAVANAELTLQTVVTIRDRVVQAYQDIIRMPI